MGVNQAKDILDHKSDFLKYEDFESRYKVKTTFLTYYGVVSATAKLKKSFQDQVTMNSNQPTCGQKLLSASNICKEAYKLIVKRISSTPANSQTKWITDCGNYANSIKWDKSYNLPFYCTRETKLQLSNLNSFTEELLLTITFIK